MRQTQSAIIFNVLRRHLPQAPDSKLVKIAEKLQGKLGMNDQKSQVSPAREGEITMPTTLLFVDDNIVLVETATKYMGEIRPQWRFLLAHTLAEARRIYNRYSPDAAVLDVELPDGNGLDLLSEFKRRRPWLPIIMISGDDPAELRKVVIDRGAYTFLAKPFSAPVLVDHIESAITAYREQYPAPAAPTPETREVWKNPHALALRPEGQKPALYDPEDASLNRLILK
jgi:DNA-binding NtrC family response regulator